MKLAKCVSKKIYSSNLILRVEIFNIRKIYTLSFLEHASCCLTTFDFWTCILVGANKKPSHCASWLYGSLKLQWWTWHIWYKWMRFAIWKHEELKFYDLKQGRPTSCQSRAIFVPSYPLILYWSLIKWNG